MLKYLEKSIFLMNGNECPICDVVGEEVMIIMIRQYYKFIYHWDIQNQITDIRNSFDVSEATRW